MPIVNAIKKYGADYFIIEELARFYTKEEAIAYEIKCIAELKPHYNVHAGGTGGARFAEENGMFGIHHTDEWKASRSVNMMGANNHMFGKTHTDEVKLVLSNLKKGSVPWNKGKISVYTEEALNKMRKPKSEDHKKALRKKYVVTSNNQTTTVLNAKEYCEQNNLNYIVFTQSAKKNKPYKGLKIKVVA